MVAVLFVCMMVLGISTTAFAAGINHFPYSAGNKLATNNGEWRTIAYSDNGFNCKVYIESSGAYSTNNIGVRMLDQNGSVVWQDTGAQSANGSRIYNCGSNIYTIQIKNQVGAGYAWARYYSEL